MLSPMKNRLNSLDDFSPTQAQAAPEVGASGAQGQVLEENPLLQLYLDEVAAGPDASFPLQNQHVSYAKIFSECASWV